jgi:iron complex outermembrane receptor protein
MFHATPRKRAQCLAMSGIAALVTGTAYAQEAPEEPSTVSADIIVTAQRRAERLLDVPISVTALGGEALADSGITSSKELPMAVPGLRVESTGAYVQPTIRGISTSVLGPTAETNIATYIDGVYQTSQAAAIYELPDVDRIEVLKGPQGTLFGRNATGGAIIINTLKPDLNEVTGMISTSYGRFDDLTLKGHASAPLIQDKLAVGISGAYQNRDGFRRDLLNNRRRVGEVKSLLLRGKIRFLPWEGADFILTGLYSDRDDFDAVRNTNYQGNNAGRRTLPASQIASRPWESSVNEIPYALSKQWSLSLRGDIEVGPGTLTTTTAYTRDENKLASDSDNSPLPSSYIVTPGFARSFQQELIYATDPIGSLRGIVGLFYYQNEGGQDLNVNRNALTIFQRDKVQSYAAFGELVLDVSDQLSLTGGIRYSHDKQEAFVTSVPGTGIKPAVIPRLGERSWNAWTPRASILYKVTDRTNLYLTYSQGFKAGLFNTVSFQATPVNPEKVKAFEAGIKSTEIEGLSLSFAGFHYDYKDLQQPTAILNAGVPRQELRNAASSKIYGAEATADLRLAEGLSLAAGLTYLHAEFRSYPAALVNVPTGLGGNSLQFLDVSGNTLIRAPKWSGNINARYSTQTSIGRIEAAGALFYSSKFYLEPGNRITQPAYAQVNATLGWQPTEGGVELKLWGKNLTNKAVIFGANPSAGGDVIFHGPPRTYGIEASYRF